MCCGAGLGTTEIVSVTRGASVDRDGGVELGAVEEGVRGCADAGGVSGGAVVGGGESAPFGSCVDYAVAKDAA